MPVRFYKKIRIFKNFYLNISRNGISFSLGERGKSLNISRQGLSGSVGLPGTGLSYRKRLYKWAKPCEPAALKTKKEKP